MSARATAGSVAMRIGTWNLAGRWTVAHERLILSAACDVWMLTEVVEKVHLPGFDLHLGTQEMAPGRRWAAIASADPLHPRPDPHPASAAARIGQLAVVCSVLPWRTCGPDPWGEGGHHERTTRAVRRISDAWPAGLVVWGGDWNHALVDRETAGSLAGRGEVIRVIEERSLQVPTTNLPHQLDELRSIDHIAVPAAWQVRSAEHVAARIGGRNLSDHDAYVVELALPDTGTPLP